MAPQPSSPRAVRLERAILLCTVLFMLSCVLCIAVRFAYQWMDGSWNAQVAEMFARTGRYAATYPVEDTFCVYITTGQTVLLPAALAFRLGGVSELTAAIVPVLYMCATLLALLAVLFRFFRSIPVSSVCRAVLCSVSALFCFFTFSLYGRYAYQLLGEGAGLLFLVLACLFLAGYAQTRRRRDALACGAMLACALITKTVAVCFVLVFLLLMLLECLLTRRFPISFLFYLLAGFILAFGALESFKFFQFGRSRYKWREWWRMTFLYSFDLSAGSSASLSFPERLAANLRAASDLLTHGSIAALVLLLLIAPLCYLASLWARLTHRADPFDAPGRFALLALGLGGDGFLVASLLFTSGGMFSQRRMMLHGVCFLAFVVPVLLVCILRAFRRATPQRIGAAALSVLLTLSLLPNVASSAVTCFRYDQSEDAQRSADVKAYIQGVRALMHEDALYYGSDWAFAAETALMLSLPMINLETHPIDFSDGRAHYLLAESSPIDANLASSYSLTPVYRLREDADNYIVYLLEPPQ